MNTVPVIPRLEDLPYISAPPIEFVYRSTQNFNAGIYTWADSPLPLTPDRPLMVSHLYYFRSITMTADVEELDFTSVFLTIPKFQMYLKSNAKTILFREPVVMAKYFQNFDYRYTWLTRQNNDQLLASFNGSLSQNANMVGKASVTLTAIISAQEISDEGFIRKFCQRYPGGE